MRKPAWQESRSGAEGIPVDQRTRAQLDIDQLEAFKARGVQDLCRRCSKRCKVLAASAGLEATFVCFDFEGKA